MSPVACFISVWCKKMVRTLNSREVKFMKSFYEMMIILEGSQGMKARTRRADWLARRRDDLEANWSIKPQDYEDFRSDAIRGATRSLEADSARTRRQRPGRYPAPHHDMESDSATEKMMAAAAPSVKMLDRLIHSLSFKGDLAGLRRYVDSYPGEKDDKFWVNIARGGAYSGSREVIDYAVENIRDIKSIKGALGSAIAPFERLDILGHMLDLLGNKDSELGLSLLEHAVINGKLESAKYIAEQFPDLPLDKLREMDDRLRKRYFPVYSDDHDWRDDDDYESKSRRKTVGPALNFLGNLTTKRFWDIVGRDKF